MQPGEGYTSCFTLLRQNRIKQCKDLCCYNSKTGLDTNTSDKNISEIKKIIDHYTTPRYHLIRTKKGNLQHQC